MRTRRLIAVVAAAMVLGLLAATVLVFLTRWEAWRSVEISGVVLRNDEDPKKQVPIADAVILASDGELTAAAHSGPNGYFQVKFAPAWRIRRPIRFSFRHPGYESLELAGFTNGQICVARLNPQARLSATWLGGAIALTNVRVRYSVKSTNPVNIGSAAHVFEAFSKGNIPCASESPHCSPDGKWQATLNQQVFDAGPNNEFRNARLSCIAGPCPFTQIEGDMVLNGRELRLAVLNWSSTATFLLEAEVMHTQMNNIVRLMYPVIFGTAMNFTLPAESEGATVLAELNGTEIVFPLGPRLLVSWGACIATQAADNSRQFRCELKPGYVFR